MQKSILVFVGLFFSLLSLSLESNNGWDAVDQLSYNLMKDENIRIHSTKLFRHQPGLHVRHDFDLRLSLEQRNLRCEQEPFKFNLIENMKSVFIWTERALVQNGMLNFNLCVNRSIPVGQYALTTVDPCTDDKLGGTVHLGEVNIMFNPMLAQKENLNTRIQRQTNSDNLMAEYINNNYGLIWVVLNDTEANILYAGTIPWNYNIGSRNVVDSTNALMKLMTQEERLDPVLYSRALTKLISKDVLEGRWKPPYGDGMEPWKWVGSDGILYEWLRTRTRVRYGQCWVFAAILTTILRASGIPARTVTNYGSLHDRGLTGDRTRVLRQYDNIRQPDEDVWNFHVWSEAWLERPDLGQPAEWNAVDATPQEPSPLQPGEPYRSGPAYVPFIRSNMRTENYDTYFISAEVNGVNICPLTGNILPNTVGRAVYTKKPGLPEEVRYDPEDITNNYKISSPSKRSLQASNNTTLTPPYMGCEREGGMRLNAVPLRPRVGEHFVLTVTEGNVSVEDTVIQVESRSYMGESLGLINTFTGIKELNVTESDYLPYLSNSNIFRFSVGTYNESGGFVRHDDLDILLGYNQLDVQAVKAPKSNIITLTLTYTNPLSIPLTGVEVSVASPDNAYIIREQQDIPAGTQFTTTIDVQCFDDDDGDVMIPVSFAADEIQSAYGIGWSNCREEPETGGSIMLSEISGQLMMLLSLLALSLFI